MRIHVTDVHLHLPVPSVTRIRRRFARPVDLAGGVEAETESPPGHPSEGFRSTAALASRCDFHALGRRSPRWLGRAGLWTLALAQLAAWSIVRPGELNGQALARREIDTAALASRIVDALALRPGERVLLVGHPQFARDLVRPLRLEVVRQGGVDLGLLEVLPHPWPQGQDLGTRQRERAALREMFALVDAAVMLPGSTSDHPEYQAMYDVLMEGRGRTIHLHWDANGSVGLIPGRPAPPVHEVDLVYERAILDVDLNELRRRQEAFVAAMRGGEVRVNSPDGSDLRFRIGDRPVNRQDGEASAARTDSARVVIDREIELPAGAVRVAPVETSVNGVVVIPLSWWAGREVRDLRLVFRAGRVAEVTAGTGVEAVRDELERGGDAARALREFALGFNPLLAVPEGRTWIPYYGYGAGVVRLALGDNQELGGSVRGSYVRIFLFPDASVTVDGQPWVVEGRLVAPEEVQ